MGSDGESNEGMQVGVVRITEDCIGSHAAMNLLPCSVSWTGPARVSSFFLPKSTTPAGLTNVDGVVVMEAALRGRRLLGCEKELPPNFRGYVLGKEERQGKKSSGKVEVPDEDWRTRAGFRSLSYWKHDLSPTPTDSIPRCFDWLELSTVIHGRVPTDEIKEMVAKLGDGTRGVKRKSF